MTTLQSLKITIRCCVVVMLLSIHSIAFLIAAISAAIFVVIPSIGYDKCNLLPLFGGQITTPAPP